MSVRSRGSPCAFKEPDILLLPFLLPLFILGSIPLLLLAFLGFAGLGLAGLLMLLAAQRDEFDAHGDFHQPRHHRRRAAARPSARCSAPTCWRRCGSRYVLRIAGVQRRSSAARSGFI